MLRKKLWLAGVVGAVCLAISAGIAQDRAPEAGTPNPATQDESRGLTVIPRHTPPQSGRSADQQAREFQEEIRRYQRSRPTASSTRDAAAPSRVPIESAPRNTEQRTPAKTTTGIRNYHKELFGTDPPTPGTQSQIPSRPLELSELKPATAGQTQSAPLEKPATTSIQQTSLATPPQIEQLTPASEVSPLFEGPTQRVIPADYTARELREPVVPVAATRSAASLPATIEKLPVTDAPPQTSAIQPLVGAHVPQHLSTNLSKGSPRIETEWRRKSDINVGQACQLELIVKNSGNVTASHVEISAEFPPTVRFTDASPKPLADGTWKIPEMVAGNEHRIEVTLIPLQRGEIAANANVRFTSAATSIFIVEEPMLALVVQGPEQVKLGEPASHIVTISNPGTGVAHDVSLMVNVPEGLEHASQRNRLMMELGSLSPGEKRNVRLSLTAIGGGEQSLVIDAKSGTELTRQSKSLVKVLTPELVVAITGPSLRYVGRDARYNVSVSNNGAATTENVRAMYAVPDGFEFLDASRGGKFDESTRIISWFVGSVKAAESVELSLKLRPARPGDFAHAARVVSEHGEIAEAQSETRIEGTASLVLKVADLDDPVETGRETAYEISVQNDGSKEAQNVGLSIELPVGVKLIDVKGPTTHIAESGLVVFKSLPALPAGKTATYRLFVRGTEEGNQRLRARLTSDSIQEPLTVEELTRFYAD